MTDESYTLTQATDAYLRSKRRRLAESSYREYASVIEKMLHDLGPDIEVSDLEPPRGTELLEDFLDGRWAVRYHAYNRNLSVVRGFIKFLMARERVRADPTASIERARPERHAHFVFPEETIKEIIAAAETPRDRIALRLLLIYGLRKGALMGLQLVCFDLMRRQISFKTKGRKYHTVPILGDDIWADLLEIDGQPGDFLLHRRTSVALPLSPHGLHLWWYGRLAAAGVVPEGTTSGRRLHDARHSAGQRVLDKTHNLKAAQALLGHASIATTGDVYALDINTPILTVSGWKTMGTVQVGDYVYAEDGSLTIVTHASSVFIDTQCFGLSFADGSTIVASSDHRWKVWDSQCTAWRRGGGEVVLTTDELASTFHRWGRHRYRVRSYTILESTERESDRFVAPLPQVKRRGRRNWLMNLQNVERVETRPTRCIAVAHESHMYLVGQTLVPTHNTDWDSDQLRESMAGLEV